MKKSLLLIKTTLLLTIFGTSNLFAQYVDVTSQYISNAGFEECEALPVVVYHDNQKDIDINKIEVWSHWNTAKGTDYESTGWKLVEQMKNANGGVVVYGVNIQSGQYATAGEPGPTQGITGTKGLCFCGAAGLVYQQANEITLPAGTYRLTVNLYARNGQTTNPGPTQQVNNIKTGFMPTGGTEDDLIPAKRTSKQFKSNAWDTEVLDIELTQSTKGRFQISYGSSYFVVVDDVKLEYQGGVVTTALANVVTKAIALNVELNNSDLTTAISAAEAFIANPTTQDDVAIEVEKLYNAMAAALATTTQPIDITSAYIDNPSFETGTFDEWTCDNGSIKNINEEAPITPRCDGVKIVECGGTSPLSQTISHLPAGFYLVSAKLSGEAKLVLGTTPSSVTGGTYNSNAPLFLRVYTPAASFEAGNITIGSSGTKSSSIYKIDDFHLYYAKDASSLDAVALAAVKSDAQAIIAESQYNNITGEERSETVTALEGSDYTTINTKLNKFVLAKTAYDDFVAAQTKAAPYTAANYPYADKTMLETVKTICGTTAQSSTLAKEMTTQLNTAIAAIPFSNAYCEGIADKVDHTNKIVGADATGSTVTGWTVNNIQICTLSNTKARPVKDQATADKTVYGTPDSYKSGTSSIQQTINNLPAGKYVLSVSIMASTNLPIAVRINNEKKNTFNGVGTAASASWREVATEFDLTAAGNVTIRLDEGEDASTKLWYADNFRLYCIDNGGSTAIQSVSKDKTTDNRIFDLSGRRISQPTKGLYIINGKKVVVK